MSSRVVKEPLFMVAIEKRSQLVVISYLYFFNEKYLVNGNRKIELLFSRA